MKKTKYNLLFLVLANLAVFSYGILTLIRPELIERGFLFFTGSNLFSLKDHDNLTYDYLLLNIKLLGAYNCVIATINLLNIIIGYLNKTRTIILIGIIGSFLAYLPAMVFDWHVGYFGTIEVIEYIFGIGIFLILIFWKRR